MKYNLNREDLSPGDWIGINTHEGIKYYKIIDIHGDSVYTSIGDINIKCIIPIPLTYDILDMIGVSRTTPKHILEQHNKYGVVYGIYNLDSCIQLVPDWRDQPSFHVGVRYTDSPFEQDEGEIYTFMYELNYLHEFQKILYLLKPKDDDLMYGDIGRIYNKLRQEDLFDEKNK